MASRRVVRCSVIIAISLLIWTLRQINRPEDEKPTFVSRYGSFGYESCGIEVLWKQFNFHLADVLATHLGPLPKGLTGKRAFFKSRIAYYQSCNSCTTFQVVSDASIQILLSGDIQQNPGPIRNPCSVCGHAVASNHRALPCVTCSQLCHIGPKCGRVPKNVYNEIKRQDTIHWNCPRCENTFNQLQTNPTLTQDQNTEIDELPNMFEELRTKLKGHGIKLAHINVRGLLSKMNDVAILLQESRIDILVITESHLDKSVGDSVMKIDGYGLERYDRDKHGGGCFIYFNECLEITPIGWIDNLGTESIWMDLYVHSQHYLIAGIYRPPNRFDFYDQLKSILETIWIKRKNIILLGDLNSDILFRGKTAEQTQLGKRLLRVTNQFSLKNIITAPTRVAENSQTTIDLIIVSNVKRISKSGTFEPAISDHKLVYAVLDVKRKKSEPSFKTVHDYKNLNQERFEKSLVEAPWWVSNILMMLKTLFMPLSSCLRIL